MMRIDNRTPLSRVQIIQMDSVNTSPLKRNLKISNQKFPSDFFQEVKELRDRNPIFNSMSKINGDMYRSSKKNLPQTQQQPRNLPINTHLNVKLGNLDQLSDIKRRQMSTALEYRVDIKRQQNQYQEQLIKSVLTSARQMKKMIRKHSIQLKKDRQHQKDEVQLPPLRLKRGFTTAL